jgi:hypothetical protein
MRIVPLRLVAGAQWLILSPPIHALSNFNHRHSREGGNPISLKNKKDLRRKNGLFERKIS